jgi:hypothetical protein
LTVATFARFCALRDEFKTLTKKVETQLPTLKKHIQQLADEKAAPQYTVDTPVVYNKALDDITQNDAIKLILIGDNPGRREQEAQNNRYLVGPSGKIAQGFFKNTPELGIDFRANVIILNKTPVHTPRTADLKRLIAIADGDLKRKPLRKDLSCAECIRQSQIAMAQLLEQFYLCFKTPVWITGYSEMKKNGIFESYTNALSDLFATNTAFKESVFVYRHFSMNQFTIDLHQQTKPQESAADALNRIGAGYRQRIWPG